MERKWIDARKAAERQMAKIAKVHDISGNEYVISYPASSQIQAEYNTHYLAICGFNSTENPFSSGQIFSTLEAAKAYLDGITEYDYKKIYIQKPNGTLEQL